MNVLILILNAKQSFWGRRQRAWTGNQKLEVAELNCLPVFNNNIPNRNYLVQVEVSDWGFECTMSVHHSGHSTRVHLKPQQKLFFVYFC